MATIAEQDWPAVIDELCQWLAHGRTVRSFCRLDGKPGRDQLYDHIAAGGEELERRIVRARAQGSDDLAEEGLEILDECADKPELANACKARFEGRLKLLAKWNSGRYGDKSQVEHSGKIGLDALIAQTAAQKPPAPGGD